MPSNSDATESKQASQARQPSPAAGPDALSNPVEAKAAHSVASTVMKALTSQMSSMTGGPRDTGADQSQIRHFAQSGAQIRGMRSDVGGFGDEADQRVRDAATVAAYKHVVDMMNDMQSKLQSKQSVDEAISNYDRLLEKSWEGRKAMPVYAMDEASGKLKIVGKRAMTYEEAQSERDKLRDQKDSISELNQQDMLLLQQLMEKKNLLEQMVSNVMKAGYEGGQAAISALKPS